MNSASIGVVTLGTGMGMCYLVRGDFYGIAYHRRRWKQKRAWMAFVCL
jgi:hypothetical protein